MPIATGIVKGQQPYPVQDVNPLEATFCLLKALRDEIREMREMLDEERQAREREDADLAAQVKELRGTEQGHFGEIDNAIEDMKADVLSRFQKLQEQMEQVVKDKLARFEKLEATVDSESNDRKSMFQAVNKRLTQDAQQWRVRAEMSDRELKDHKRQAEIYGSNTRQRHEDLQEEVERLAVILRDNSMARDPFRHFTAKPKLPALGTTAPPAVSTATQLSFRAGSPIQTERSMNRVTIGTCTKCEFPDHEDMNLPGACPRKGSSKV